MFHRAIIAAAALLCAAQATAQTEVPFALD